ncbi:transcriptional regulator, TetR family [Kribbella flavida DSM 17836]|uniref:Transcriptional regulator, TetR family n=1 Tax=Kribbella flavida (strain DSM 17836 / JCM 10339 / NBRC 14399) TaxID=479435 RepID=D2PRU7_KRIFD|nr:TetR/AcrR family transcriptional regulator [Kribbella flavida]ADB29277.1 transcriptional regulator, TetR family [Kribbella flavida DSM 17836]
MNAGRTARDRARAELTREIKDAARRQLAAEGAERLSLRAVSRELGMVSSALYRYFPSRDDLLTALIIDAYDALGAAAEDAARAEQDPRAAWLAISRAVRSWAKANPHEYALIYGSPVPGYTAPQTTIQPATRVAAALLGVLSRAQEAGVLVVPADAVEPHDVLVEQLAQLIEVAPGVPESLLLRMAMVWTQLFGLISFELFGQLVGTFDPADTFFELAIAEHAAFVGLGEGVG